MQKKVVRGDVKKITIEDGKITISRIAEHITICNICKEEIKQGAFEDSEIELDAKIGSVYPEGDSRNGYRIDICEECFMNKIKPLIEKTFDTVFKEYSCDSYNYDEKAEEHPLTDEQLEKALSEPLLSKDMKEKIKEYNENLKKAEV